MEVDAASPQFCPVPGCLAEISGEHAGWSSWAGLRAHVDAHLRGLHPGLPPEACMKNRNVCPSNHCRRLVSKRCKGGVHGSCLARHGTSRVSQAPAHTLPDAPDDRQVQALLDAPRSLDEICLASVPTRDFIGASLLPKAEKALARCTAGVLQHNRADAWRHLAGVDRVVSQILMMRLLPLGASLRQSHLLNGAFRPSVSVLG